MKQGIIVNTRVPLQEKTLYQFSRPIDKGSEIHVKVGEYVRPETILSSAWHKSGYRTFNLAEMFGVTPKIAAGLVKRTIGSRIYQGDIMAVKKEWFGLREKIFRSPLNGIFFDYEERTARVTLQYLPREIKTVAGVFGAVSSILPDESLTIDTVVDLVYGLVSFGIDREGTLVEIGYPDVPLQADQLSERHSGKVIFGGTHVTVDFLYKALSLGVKAIVTGGVAYEDYIYLLSSKGNLEDIGISLIATEGFIATPIYQNAYNRLKESENRHVFFDAARTNLVLTSAMTLGEKLEGNVVRENRGFTLLEGTGMIVRILSGENMGEYGLVKSVSEEVVEVELATGVVSVNPQMVELIN